MHQHSQIHIFDDIRFFHSLRKKAEKNIFRSHLLDEYYRSLFDLATKTKLTNLNQLHANGSLNRCMTVWIHLTRWRTTFDIASLPLMITNHLWYKISEITSLRILFTILANNSIISDELFTDGSNGSSQNFELVPLELQLQHFRASPNKQNQIEIFCFVSIIISTHC